MKILDLQRRLREIGRIRIGEQVPTSNGKTRPSKLEHFRFTSRDRAVIDAAAEKFGGTVEAWASPDGQQWQVKTDVDELQVIVPPGDMSFSQSYEQWSAGGCRVRCDGQWNSVADQACSCDPTVRACDIHTRLSVLLVDLPGFGVWRLDTQGYYAAVELGGVVEIAAGFSDRGRMIPARLRLEQRSVKRIINGESKTHRFAVPILDLAIHPLELVQGASAAGELGAVPSFTPVPVAELADATQSVADQLAAVEEPVARRRGSASPIPPTGILPRTAEEAESETIVRPASDDQHDALVQAVESLTADEKKTLSEWWTVGWGTLKHRNLTEDQAAAVAKKIVELVQARPSAADESSAPASPDDNGDPGTGEERGPLFTSKQIATAASKAFPLEDAPRGQKTKLRDRLRYALTFMVTNGERWHMADLHVDEMTALDARLTDIAQGRMTFVHDDTGVTFAVVGSEKSARIDWSQFEDQST